MAQLNTILADGYDRETFERVFARHQGLQNLCERLARILPHAKPLLLDLFSLLFKLNTVLLPAKDLSPAVLINRRVVEVVLKEEGLTRLRRHTELEQTSAGAATRLLGERILESLKQEFRDHPRELVDALESARDEERLEERRGQLEHLEGTEEFSEDSRENLTEELSEEIEELEAALERHRKRQTRASRIAAKIDESISEPLEKLPEQLEETEHQARSLGVGSDEAVDAERRMELGDRIMGSRKLKMLARLVGAFREVALEARRRRVVQAPQELHTVTLGAELERLLPSELLGLCGEKSRGLHLEFLRRLAEKQLLEYKLEAASSRGPMVVCLDGSGSMQGSKELWGKAVTLTLMEIAKRERRRCLAMIFSSGHPLFELELLTKAASGRTRVRDEEVLHFAEHFPGGGTDFEPPLGRAIDAVTGGDYKRGDIVFITDGHAPVSDGLVERITRERKKHRFKIRTILVDVGDHESREVERFSDDIRRITDLTADSLTDMFAAV